MTTRTGIREQRRRMGKGKGCSIENMKKYSITGRARLWKRLRAWESRDAAWSLGTSVDYVVVVVSVLAVREHRCCCCGCRAATRSTTGCALIAFSARERSLARSVCSQLVILYLPNTPCRTYIHITNIESSSATVLSTPPPIPKHG